MQRILRGAKAIAATFSAALGLLWVAADDFVIDQAEWRAIAAAALTGLVTWLVPNAPKAEPAPQES